MQRSAVNYQAFTNDSIMMMYESHSRRAGRRRRTRGSPRHCGRPPTHGDVPNPDSEAGHGETVSVEDPHRQPHAASRNADAELRLRSATVRSRQTTDLPD